MIEPVLPLLPVAAIFLLAGMVKGVIGLGLPTVAMGLLGLVMPPAEAAALLILPSFVTNVWQLLAGPQLGSLLRGLWPMMLAALVATIAASAVIVGSDARLAAAGLGVALLLYAVLGLMNVRMQVPPRARPWAGPLVGLVTGGMTGATGVFAIPAVPYLAGLDLGRDGLVQALGLSFTVSTVALAIGLAWHGALPLRAAGISLGAVVPALAGMAAGGWLRQSVHPETFRKWFFLGLAGLGLHLAWQAA